MSVELVPDNNDEPLLPLPSSEPSNQFMASLPDDAESFLAGPSTSLFTGGSGVTEGVELPAGEFGPTPQERAKKRVKMSRKMQKMMDGFRDQVADIPIMWFHNMAKDQPEWALDAKEEEFLKDAFGVVFEVLDISIEIEALNLTLTSIWWVIAYPFAAFAFLFLTHKAKVAEKGQPEE